ncbi:hypothetical protein [Bernardetia sp. MNP-M8]|uniref:hypothetical protein n=1 Tax=Bernardetia sp. MNP-M8 TaxID=3127470 RepID=UPI0030D5C9AA
MAKKTTKKATQSSATDVLVIPSKKATLSTPQKTYNRNIKEIDKRKLELQGLEKEIRKIQQRVHSEIFPELDTLQKLRVEKLEKMDAFFDQKLSKKHTEKLMDIFFEELDVVIGESMEYPMDEQIKERVTELHDKHADMTIEEVQNEAKEDMLGTMKNDLEEMGLGGIDLEDFDFSMDGMKKIMEAMFEKQKEEQGEREQERIETDEKFAAKKQNEKEEEKERTKTVKGIYKRLVKELHPDLEADIDEQARKNELMQRITQAYNDNDFFELLKLNIEHQTRNKGDISKLADQEIEYYNQILKSQIKDLKMNIKALKQSFLYDYYGGSPQRLGQVIRRCKEKINSEKEICQHENETTFSSLKNWKESLKHKVEEEDDFSIFALIFGGNAKEHAYKEKMDFIYGNTKMPFGF